MIKILLVILMFSCYFLQIRTNKIIKDEKNSEGVDLDTKYNSISNCSECRVRKATKALRIEVIKGQILSKLGLKRAPNIAHIRLLPNESIIYQLFVQYPDMPQDSSEQNQEKNEEEEVEGEVELDDYHAKPEKIVLFSSDVPSNFPIPDELQPDVIYFNSSLDMDYIKVVKANLWIYTQYAEEETTVLLNISKIYPSFNNRLELITSNIRLQNLKSIKEKGSWSQHVITEEVLHWLNEPNDNYGILVQAMTNDGTNIVVNHPQAEEEDMRPFIELSVDNGGKKRKKRMINPDCEENSVLNHCCRDLLVVDFVDDFGWKWVIAPTKYNANICLGECPYYQQEFSHNNLVKSANLKESAKHCCVPSKWSPIPMLYYGDDNRDTLMFSIIPNMVIDSCGCH